MCNSKQPKPIHSLDRAIKHVSDIALGHDSHGELTTAGMKLIAQDSLAILKKVKLDAQPTSNHSGSSISLSEKLINWIDDPHRPKASTFFPECVERQIAIRFETLFDRLKTLNKSD